MGNIFNHIDHQNFLYILKWLSKAKKKDPENEIFIDKKILSQELNNIEDVDQKNHLNKDIESALLLGAGFSLEMGIPTMAELWDELNKTITSKNLYAMRPRFYAERINISGKFLKYYKGLYKITKKVKNYEEQIGLLEDFEYFLNYLFKKPPFKVSQTYSQWHIKDPNPIPLVLQWLLTDAEILRHYIREQINRVIFFRHLINIELMPILIARYEGFSHLVNRYHPLWVFTLNHDLCVELICAELGIPIACPKNVLQSTNPYLPGKVWKIQDFLEEKDFFHSGETGINILKLHGAINEFYTLSEREPQIIRFSPIENTVDNWLDLIWILLNEMHSKENLFTEYLYPAPYGFMNLPIRTNLEQMIRMSTLTGKCKLLDGGFLNNPISGTAIEFNESKYETYRRPPKDTNIVDYHKILYNKFASTLKRIKHLFVVGYSFSDEHINAVLQKWLDMSSSNIIDIINPYPKIPECLNHAETQINFIRKGTTEWLNSFNNNSKELKWEEIHQIVFWNNGRTSEENVLKKLTSFYSTGVMDLRHAPRCDNILDLLKHMF